MKALVYYGLHDVNVVEVPDAKIERSTDVLLKITTTNILTLRMMAGLK